MLELGLSLAVAAIAVVLTVALVTTFLPVGAGLGGVAVTFLGLSGAMSGYSAWRWVRWVRSRVERMHWSVVAALGAGVTASELFAMTRLATDPLVGSYQQLSGLAGFSLLAALTLAITGVTSLGIHHRAMTDRAIDGWAQRRFSRLVAA
ncbi:hypothetical protein [Cryptosporangium phraense]|uniref:Uncharacterized protein n=1 Tax=Cryptosporangium phraense TaxID=2593070 RepID=A0A545AG70_9ACTN|nr:hypothetical protein [Cryptosporangium phraense]TQS40327.1 hypothetical protein FL583_35515 [Cryptosporangium phraense]